MHGSVVFLCRSDGVLLCEACAIFGLDIKEKKRSGNARHNNIKGMVIPMQYYSYSIVSF